MQGGSRGPRSWMQVLSTSTLPHTTQQAEMLNLALASIIMISASEFQRSFTWEVPVLALLWIIQDWSFHISRKRRAREANPWNVDKKVSALLDGNSLLFNPYQTRILGAHWHDTEIRAGRGPHSLLYSITLRPSRTGYGTANPLKIDTDFPRPPFIDSSLISATGPEGTISSTKKRMDLNSSRPEGGEGDTDGEINFVLPTRAISAETSDWRNPQSWGNHSVSNGKSQTTLPKHWRSDLQGPSTSDEDNVSMSIGYVNLLQWKTS